MARLLENLSRRHQADEPIRTAVFVRKTRHFHRQKQGNAGFPVEDGMFSSIAVDTRVCPENLPQSPRIVRKPRLSAEKFAPKHGFFDENAHVLLTWLMHSRRMGVRAGRKAGSGTGFEVGSGALRKKSTKKWFCA